MYADENKKMCGGHVYFTLFYKFRTSKDLEILRQSSYMSRILKGLSKRNTQIQILYYLMKMNGKKCVLMLILFFLGVEDISGE